MPTATHEVRPPAVAGTFYPGDAAVLAAHVDRLLAEVPVAPGPSPKALIAPHAGYVYSGPVAARAYAALRADAASIRRIVLLGPAHRVPVQGLALPAAEALRTPLGDVPIDLDAAADLIALPQVSVSSAVHAREHSLEVHLPFLQRVLPRFTLVPLAVGDADPEEVAEVLERLWDGPATRIVVSSDLSHYLPYSVARSMDESTAQAIEHAELVGTDRACGAHAVNGLLLVARRRRLRVTRLDLRSSGDTAGGRDEVVGYGAFACAEEAS